MKEIISFVRSRQPVNFIIVLMNVVVFLVLSVMGDTQDAVFMLNHGASWEPYILEYGEYYRLVTCIFLHFGIDHLFYNMLLLICLGDSLEQIVGKLRYLMIYLLGGVAGNIVSVWVSAGTENYAVSAGASGAIFAVVGALLWIVIRNGGRLKGYSSQRLFLMAALTIVNGLTTTGVDNMAHIGGLAAGFLLGMLLYRKKAEEDFSKVSRP